MKNLWRYSGWFLIAIGIFHNVVGLIVGQNIILEIIEDGVLNTIHLDHDRNAVFWFLATGFFWIIMGLHWQSLIRIYNRPLSALVGWGMLIFAVVGVFLSPDSGIWLFFPLGWMILQPHIGNKKQKSI